MIKPDNVVSIFKNVRLKPADKQLTDEQLKNEQLVSLADSIDLLINDAILNKKITPLEVLAILNNRTKELARVSMGNPAQVLSWLGDELKKP